MKKAKLFFSTLFVLLTVAVSAQNVTVRGTVKDASTGEAIPFAAIQVKGTSTGIASDADGVYSISVPSSATLVFSSVGYLNAEVAVSGRSSINVELEPDSEALENAVVIGYGSARKVGNLVGSVTTVRSDIVKNAPSASALDNLQGQVAGLSVLTTGGVAGDNATSMQLHGMGSLTSSTTPLYVIDGVPSGSYSIQMMNPNDILSISVLKDAASTSIYGARAANGVVFITTKSGAYNSEAKVTVRSQYGISTLVNTKFYESFMSGDELKDFWLRTGMYTPEQFKANYTDKGYTANTQWYKVMQQLNNPQYQNDFTVEGGGSKVAYMISASQFHQRGTSIGNYYDRYTLRSNVQGHPKDWLKIGVNLNLSVDENQQNGNWNGSSISGNYISGGLSYMMNPLIPAYDEDGELYPYKFPNGTANPYYYMETYPSVSSTYGLNGSTYIEIEPFKNLKLRSQIGTDTRFARGNSASIPSSKLRSGTGARSKSFQLMSNNTITNTIEYSFTAANDHSVTLLAGHEGVSNWYDRFSASSSGQTEDRLLILQQGTSDSYSISESSESSRFLSFFGHSEYSYANKYIFTADIRNDASSRFGINKRNATFWAVGGRWNLSRESFLKNSPWLSNASLKLSYGTQGNASIGNYEHLALISTTTNYHDGNAWVVGQPSNNNLTWEQQALFTAGISGRLFDAVDLEVEFYNRKTTNMLMDVPYPYTTGFDELTANVGGLTNTGIDVTLGIDILRNRDYYLRFNSNFNYNSEKVAELFDAAWDEDLQRYRWQMNSYGLAYVQGMPVMFYAPVYAGIDPEDGRQMWYVPGDDPDVTTKDKTTKNFDDEALTQNTGLKYTAPINGGFSLRGGWKFLSFAADFSYVLGKTLINNDAIFYENPNLNSAYNKLREVSDYWTPENPNAKYPDWTKGQRTYFCTHLYHDASFMRLKNLQIGASIPNRWLESQKLFDSVRLTFTGRNLLTLTKYPGIDPEVDSNLTRGRVGASKQYLIGLELTF
ncbi:MAG: SusC/RagA family TonB-linked outer membrane protein [Bacteroidales bacterium]|jgi:TonB-linked outer membrane protein, SusC/RagA family|nr:SusC/RagA family TonB-linked outer membrane protein [Bacteroidales bacterium]